MEFNDVTPRCECVVCVCAQPESLAILFLLFVFCLCFVFLSIYARAHSCQWKCHLFDESPIKPFGLSQLLTLWPCLNSPILLPRGGAVRFMDWTQATGPLNSSLFSRRFLADIPHMGLGLKHVLEREKINGLMGKWLWLPTLFPHCARSICPRDPLLTAIPMCFSEPSP